MLSGIYWIRNLINNKIYVGSSKDLENREYVHFSRLKNNHHANLHLQFSYNKYGKENFVFETLMTCHPDMLSFYEQQFLDQWKPEYNKSKYTDSPMRGKSHTEETKEKMKLCHINRKYPEFEKTWKNPFYKGKHLPDDVKEKLRLAHIGKKHSEEAKRKCAIASAKSRKNVKFHNIKLLSPDGIIYENIYNLSKFGREHNLNAKHIWNITSRKTKFYREWSLAPEESV